MIWTPDTCWLHGCCFSLNDSDQTWNRTISQCLRHASLAPEDALLACQNEQRYRDQTIAILTTQIAGINIILLSQLITYTQAGILTVPITANASALGIVTPNAATMTTIKNNLKTILSSATITVS